MREAGQLVSWLSLLVSFVLCVCLKRSAFLCVSSVSVFRIIHVSQNGVRMSGHAGGDVKFDHRLDYLSP